MLQNYKGRKLIFLDDGNVEIQGIFRRGNQNTITKYNNIYNCVLRIMHSNNLISRHIYIVEIFF